VGGTCRLSGRNLGGTNRLSGRNKSAQWAEQVGSVGGTVGSMGGTKAQWPEQLKINNEFKWRPYPLGLQRSKIIVTGIAFPKIPAVTSVQ
jgi:hypothetical protein